MGRIVENIEEISRLKEALQVIKSITAEMSWIAWHASA